jgi:putative DNA primase/helicase
MTVTALVKALGGDHRRRMVCCPAHDDNTPSLSIGEGLNGKVLFHCFAGCSQAAVLDALRARRLWPVPGTVSPAMTPRRSYDERREYALKILADTRANRGAELEELLADYFAQRGIERVPVTAMFALPWSLDPQHRPRLIPDDPAMVFEVTDGTKTLGAHVTWLKWDKGKVTGKRNLEPQRQFFGPVGGGFVRLYDGEVKPSKLIIAEGVETAMAASQLAHLPAIAALSATNLPKITPPAASEYIIAADNDASGVGQRAARALASKLVRAGHLVRIAIPPRPDTDWNDELYVLVERRK